MSVFVPARTPSMKQLFMAEECGHVVANPVPPLFRTCPHSACDGFRDATGGTKFGVPVASDFTSNVEVTWVKLFRERPSIGGDA
jgi:hypothetical protein